MAAGGTLQPGVLLVERVSASVGGNQHAPVMELHQAPIADHLHLLARQPGADLVVRGGEADRALGTDPPGGPPSPLEGL